MPLKSCLGLFASMISIFALALLQPCSLDGWAKNFAQVGSLDDWAKNFAQLSSFIRMQADFTKLLELATFYNMYNSPFKI